MEHADNYHKLELDVRQPDIVKSIDNSLAAHEANIKGIIRQVYFLAKENIPLVKLKSLNSIIKQLGIFCGKKYISRRAGTDFVMALAHVIRLQIIKAAKNSPAIAIMIDESTDVSHTGQMVTGSLANLLGTASGSVEGPNVSVRASVPRPNASVGQV